jgi:hypothetical protein
MTMMATMMVLAFLEREVLAWPLGSLDGRGLVAQRLCLEQVVDLRRAGRVAMEMHADVDHPGSALAAGVRPGGLGLYVNARAFRT